MAEIKNTFLKGKMNQDLDSRILPNGEYREAKNLSISRSESSTVGEFENVLGNTAISSLSNLTPPAIADTEIIGQLIDENSNYAYFFATDHDSAAEVRATAANNCYIIRVNLSVSEKTKPKVLVTGFFLNFNKSFRITGVNLVENLLFWTDNLNQPRKINVDLANPSDPPVEIPTHYTNEDQISVAKYAPYEPILVMDRVNAVITSPNPAVSTATIIINDAADYALIKVGDIVTDKNKITGQQITELVTVIGKPAAIAPVLANTLTLSKAITVTNGTAIDFSRPSMTNKKDFKMSNYSSGNIETITNTGINKEYTIGLAPTTNERPFIYEGKNGIPKIGDLVGGNGISSDTRISSVSVVNQYKSPNPTTPDEFAMYQLVTFTLNKTTTLIVGDNVSVSLNPDYNAAWQGDEKILEDKFVRFSYRFNFEDNEYSLMAPFSQVMFIPKQYSQFGGGPFSDEEDMDNSYKSTIINWFENNINNILLKIPMPESSTANVISELKITDVDILYKESDALAVKVLQTIKLTDQVFSSISFKDAIHSNADSSDVVQAVTKYFLDYDYSSTKPYKTLPNNQVTRVSDKVPIKALAQEIIGNRVVYGNYLDRHTSPNSIGFSAFATNKSINFDNYTQFTNHQLKQDRTYQVGFVLSDRYGRQSDVILSSYDGDPLRAGSTVFNRYNDASIQQQNPVLNWLGNALNVTLYERINGSEGPGIYSSTNPLGWYSYKIVVKQTQQEYYNVYLPGFVNGYPVLNSPQSERDTSFFTTILGDNVNKIPRDLSEVGPNDRDFTSSENIIIRVNNPRINNKTIASPVYQKNKAWNCQYYPSNVEQNIIQIGTVRDLEIQAIPFKPGVNSGEYGESKILQTYSYEGPGQYEGAVTSVNEIPEPTGAIPWGTTGPDATFYNGDSNPFIIKGNQSENKNNPIGAYVMPSSVNSSPIPENVLSMVPFLSVAETKPVESLLDIYWETSLSGNLSDLNSLVDVQDSGLIGANFEAANFPESITNSEVIGFGFNFIKGDSQLAQASYVTATINSIVDGNNTTVPTNTFTLSKNITQTSFEIKPTNEFFYSENILNNPAEGIYTITVDTLYNTIPDTIVLPNITLTNVAPTIDTFSQPTPDGTVLSLNETFTGKNGSADAAVNTTELNWSIESVSPSGDLSKFNIGLTTGVLQNSVALTDGVSYSIGIKVMDANGSGLSSIIRYVNFTIGTNTTGAVPFNICAGRQTASVPACNQNIEYRFFASTSSTGNSGTYPAHYNPNTPWDPPSIIYNVSAENDSSQTGALTQGEMYITVSMRNPQNATLQSSLFVDYLIQHRTTPLTNWTNAYDNITGADVAGTGEYVRIEIGSSNGTSPVSTTYHFSVAGEYRVISTKVSGEDCPTSNDVVFYIDFGDEINGQGEDSSCYSDPFGGIV